MTDLRRMVVQCGNITKSKGFDVTQHATQILLIATEVAEALECISLPEDEDSASEASLKDNVKDLIFRMENFESIRKNATGHTDSSIVNDHNHLDEELADIVIRVFSYIGGNDRTEHFMSALLTKIEKNRNRPHKHGKAF